eukprot:389534-Prorocentrum_minimum.AAC.1
MGFFPTVHLQCRWLVSSPPPAGCWLQQSLRNNRLASREGVRADGKYHHLATVAEKQAGQPRR